MVLRHKYLLYVFFCLLGLIANAQKKDKEWLLIDSVDYDKINDGYKPYLDSILGLVHKTNSDTAKMELLMLLAENIEDPNIWVRYNRLVYSMAVKGGEKEVFLRYKASTLNNMGFYAHTIGDMQNAIQCYSQSLSLREKIKDKNGIANSLNNLGYIFDDLQDLAKAKEYYSQGLKMREEIGDKQGMVNSLNNLGALYYFWKDFPKAIEYHELSLKLAREINYKRGIGYALNNLGNVYRHLGDLAKALDYQTQALKYRVETNDAAGLSGTYYNFANIYEEMNDLKKAEEYGLKALEVARDARHVEKTREAAFMLFQLYRKEKRFEQSLNMHLLYIQMRDSTNNENSRRASVKQQFKYEYEKKEATLKAEQEKKDVLAAEESRRQKLFMLFIGAVALGILAVALIVIRSLRITKKQKRIIERQKHMVEEKQKEILDSIHYAKRIQRALLPSEKFISRMLSRPGEKPPG
ncbi:MAG TPA: tetratricopeptide repeat protein [Bacteroidia bacterium]|nr:tetratricopeptide repeat protein [Bacteroidia bacterium]